MIEIEVRKELKAGLVELAVLALLIKRDMYGYEVNQEIDSYSRGKVEVKEGTLYPILYRLEEKGVVESYWNAPEGRGKPRKYYRVTDSGVEYFRKYKEEWFIVSEFISSVLKEKIL